MGHQEIAGVLWKSVLLCCAFPCSGGRFATDIPRATLLIIKKLQTQRTFQNISFHFDRYLITIAARGRCFFGERSQRIHHWPGAESDLQGMENENVAPGPSLAQAHRRPLWFSMIERLIERPMPIP